MAAGISQKHGGLRRKLKARCTCSTCPDSSQCVCAVPQKSQHCLDQALTMLTAELLLLASEPYSKLAVTGKTRPP